MVSLVVAVLGAAAAVVVVAAVVVPVAVAVVVAVLPMRRLPALSSIQAPVSIGLSAGL